jgi:Fe-Mn family superoxide dismutase
VTRLAGFRAGNAGPAVRSAAPLPGGGQLQPGERYTLPELPYDYAALEPYYATRALALHHGKHHAAYVAGANATLEKLAEAREQGDFATINQLQKNLAFHLSGHVLHSLFWRNMSQHGGGEPEGELAAGVVESFGSVANLTAQLGEAALAVQGSGWGALAWEPLGKRLVVEQVYDHQGNIGNGTVPLLVLDMWEHAYYLQYANVKADWVRAFWKVVNWEDVGQRLQKVRTLDLGL